MQAPEQWRPASVRGGSQTHGREDGLVVPGAATARSWQGVPKVAAWPRSSGELSNLEHVGTGTRVSLQCPEWTGDHERGRPYRIRPSEPYSDPSTGGGGGDVTNDRGGRIGAYRGICLFAVPCLHDARRKVQRKKGGGTEASEMRGRKEGWKLEARGGWRGEGERSEGEGGQAGGRRARRRERNVGPAAQGLPPFSWFPHFPGGRQRPQLFHRTREREQGCARLVVGSRETISGGDLLQVRARHFDAYHRSP